LKSNQYIPYKGNESPPLLDRAVAMHPSTGDAGSVRLAVGAFRDGDQTDEWASAPGDRPWAGQKNDHALTIFGP
jgi:hypothetical protein